MQLVPLLDKAVSVWQRRVQPAGAALKQLTGKMESLSVAIKEDYAAREVLEEKLNGERAESTVDSETEGPPKDLPSLVSVSKVKASALAAADASLVADISALGKNKKRCENLFLALGGAGECNTNSRGKPSVTAGLGWFEAVPTDMAVQHCISRARGMCRRVALRSVLAAMHPEEFGARDSSELALFSSNPKETAECLTGQFSAE